jgi:hypothetical protein
VHEESGWWGTFPLSLPMQVGDIIQFDPVKGIKRVSSVSNLPSWTVAVRVQSDRVQAGERWSRHASKALAANGQAGVSQAGMAGMHGVVEVSFSAEGGFVLEYVSGSYHKLEDVAAAQKAVFALAKIGEWNSEHALVTEVLEATPATVLVSAAQNSKSELRTTATVPVDLSGVNLGDPKFGFSRSSAETGVYGAVSQHSYPLFHCIRIRRKWWGGKFAQLQGADTPPLSEAISDDLLDEDV